MKKNFILLMSILMSAMSVNAVDWRAIETNIPNFNLYIDNDSIKVLNESSYAYAVKYSFGGDVEKVVYLKSDTVSNYLGVIISGDFDPSAYHPAAVLANTHVFMKPVDDNSFLAIPHKYILGMTSSVAQNQANTSVSKAAIADTKNSQENFSKPKKIKETDIKPVKYQQKINDNRQLNVDMNIKDYVALLGEQLNKNWLPPSSGRKTEAIIIVTIGPDGSLLRYRFAKSSGDELTDRSIVSAVKQTVPFPVSSNMKKNINGYNFQFVFNYGRFKKSVM